MIIRPNNMTPDEFQRQVNNMTKMKRGFNQTPQGIREKTIDINHKQNPDAMLKGSAQLRDKMSAFKNVPKEK